MATGPCAGGGGGGGRTRLFANTDLVAHRIHRRALDERPEREVVVPTVHESKALICGARRRRRGATWRGSGTGAHANAIAASARAALSVGPRLPRMQLCTMDVVNAFDEAEAHELGQVLLKAAVLEARQRPDELRWHDLVVL